MNGGSSHHSLSLVNAVSAEGMLAVIRYEAGVVLEPSGSRFGGISERRIKDFGGNSHDLNAV
jgi:hypothetical protein